MPPRLTVETSVWASHTQFYVVDAGRDHWSVELWDGTALERHLDVADGVVAVGTIGYCDVPVRVELWVDEPPLDLGSWDHVVDASLDLRSGRVALEEVEGDGVIAPLDVHPGVYRVRSSAAGLHAADEDSGGDRYRIQLWPAAWAEPEVRKWWSGWNPAGAVPHRTTRAGAVVLGPEAVDLRTRMSHRAWRGKDHDLYEAVDGTLWESSTLPHGGGTFQLEQLDVQEAERRYGPRPTWGPPMLATPSPAQMLRNIADTIRYSRGWRPASDAPVVEDVRRVLVGNTAVNRLWSMRWVSAVAGDNLYEDEDGSLWELRARGRELVPARLTELTLDEARAKYGDEQPGRP